MGVSQWLIQNFRMGGGGGGGGGAPCGVKGGGGGGWGLIHSEIREGVPE